MPKLLREVAIGVAQKEIALFLNGDVLDTAYESREGRVADISDQDPDGEAASEAQRSGDRGRAIAEALNRGLHLGARGLADMLLAGQRIRHRGQGEAALRRHVADR